MLLEHPFYGSTRKRKHRDDEPGVWVTPLAIRSAANGGFEALKLLLERGAYPTEDKDGKTKRELLSEEEKKAIEEALPAAIELGELGSLKLILSYLYPTDDDGNPIDFQVPEDLHKTWTFGSYISMVRNYPDKFEWMHSFGIKEHDTMSLDALPEGQTLNIQNLFERAVGAGSLECAKLLVEKYGAEPDKHRLPSTLKPLYIAAANDKPEMLRWLLGLGEGKVDIHKASGRYANGATALWAAITLKSLESVELLLRHGGPVDHIDDEIRNIDGPVKAILVANKDDRSTVRFVTEANAEGDIDKWKNDTQNLNSPYVRVELGPEDKEWIGKLEARKSDEELREEGENARELNKEEGVKKKDMSEDDPRRMMVPWPTVVERETMLSSDDDLLPEWKPLWVPVKKEGDDDDDE